MIRKAAFYLLCLFVVFIPLEATIVIGGFGSIARLVGLGAIALGLVAVASSGRFRPPTTAFYLMILFVVWVILSFFWTIKSEITAQRIATYSQLLGFVWLLHEFVDRDDKMRTIIGSFLVGCSIAALKLVFDYTQGTYYLLHATVERYSAFEKGPNEFAVMLSVGIPFCWYFAISAKSSLKKWTARVLTGVLIVATLLTGSRGGFVACVVAVSVIPFTLHSVSWKTKLTVIGIGMATFYAGVLILGGSETWERLMTIDDEVLGGGSFTHRRYYWVAGMKAFAESPIIGGGAGAFPAIIVKYFSATNVAHNVWISILVELGVVGLALFLALFGHLLRAILRFDRVERTVWLVAIATWGAGTMSLTIEYYKLTWFLFGCIAVLASLRSKQVVRQRRPALRQNIPNLGLMRPA